MFYDPDGSTVSGCSRGSGSQFPVLHVQNLDDRSAVRICSAVWKRDRAWSDAHPDHVPVFLSFNAKDAVIDQPGFRAPLPFDEDAWRRWMRSCVRFSVTGCSGPRGFSGDERVWPSLTRCVADFCDPGRRGRKRPTYASRWRERAMFAEPAGRSTGCGDPDRQRPDRGFRSDSAPRAPGLHRPHPGGCGHAGSPSGDTPRRDQAFASGAQLVSTDYYLARHPLRHGLRGACRGYALQPTAPSGTVS